MPPAPADPAELLDRRPQRRVLIWIYRSSGPREAKPVLQRPVPVDVGLLVFDPEADKIIGWPTHPPIHGQERHTIAAMNLQRKRRRRIRSENFEIFVDRVLLTGSRPVQNGVQSVQVGLDV